MQNPILKKYGPYLLNTPMGMLIGVLAGIILSWILSGEFGPEWARLYTFVVTALISLGVAGFAVAGVIANIQAQYERDEEARRRKLMAAKALLPAALSNMCATFEEGAKASVKLFENGALRKDSEFGRVSREKLQLSESALETVRDVIEQHQRDQVEVAHRLIDILKFYQICYSRWLNIIGPDPSVNHEQYGHMRVVHWAGLYAAAETMFDYARDRADLHKLNEEQIQRALVRAVNTHYQKNEQEYLDLMGDARNELKEWIR